MAIILDGTQGITFPSGATQSTAGLPLTGGTLTGGLTAPSLTSNTTIAFSDGSSQNTAPIGSPVQSWQNVTSSRAMGTTYTNSTGRPIEVCITLDGSGPGARHDIYINGTNMGRFYATDYYSSVAATTHYQMVTFIVPNGATYSDTSGNGSPSVLYWWELR